MPCYSPLKGWRDPDTNGLIFKRTSLTTETLEVACGQCLGCRLDRSLMWATRIVHEQTMYLDQHGSCWITLTYRPKQDCTDLQLKVGHHVPDDYSLHKHHFQKFMRRLRKANPQKIRYFYCGEYGEQNLRPHFHACLFNVQFDDQQIFRDDEGLCTYTSPTLEKLWPYGFSTVAELNYDTAAYTARYCLKKVTGHQAHDHYYRPSPETGELIHCEPEYINMSLKPGIGARFYEKYKKDIFPSDETPVPGKGVISSVPRYYETILASEDPETHELVKELRKKFIQEHGQDFTPDRLMDKYKVKKAQQATLRRDL